MSIALMLLGLAAGVLTGMAAGGGTVMVPGLVLLFGIAQHAAQGAVLAAFLITQTVAAIGQWQQGTIVAGPVKWMLPAAVAGAAAGAWFAGRTSPGALREIYGWYLIALGIANWINFHPRVSEQQNWK